MLQPEEIGDQRRITDSELKKKARTGTMKLVIVAALLGLVVVCMGRRAHNHGSLADSRSSEAFISRQESANFAKRHRRSNLHNAVFGTPVRDPLESKREVCELNPSCDELADHIGFQEAYRRFYGPI